MVSRISQFGIFGQGDHRGIECPVAQLDIRHIGERAAAITDPVPDGPAGMFELCRLDRKTGSGIEDVARIEIMEFQFGVHRIDLQRKQRKAHQFPDRPVDAAMVSQVASPDPDQLARHEQRCKNGRPTTWSMWPWLRNMSYSEMR